MNGTAIQERRAQINGLYDLLHKVQTMLETDSNWDDILVPLEAEILKKLRELTPEQRDTP